MTMLTSHIWYGSCVFWTKYQFIITMYLLHWEYNTGDWLIILYLHLDVVVPGAVSSNVQFMSHSSTVQTLVATSSHPRLRCPHSGDLKSSWRVNHAGAHVQFFGPLTNLYPNLLRFSFVSCILVSFKNRLHLILFSVKGFHWWEWCDLQILLNVKSY